MKSARHQLILLGLICQGFTWDNFVLPSLYVLAWVSALAMPRKPIHVGSVVEGLLLAGGGVLSFVLGRQLGANTHFFLGHGLALIQVARLLRPLNRQETLFSVLIAMFHLAVGCTFLFDYRFIPVLIATVFLVPRTLEELELAAWKQDLGAADTSTRGYRPSLGAAAYGLMTVCMALFFLFFPRIYLGSGLALPGVRGPNDPSPLDSILDLTGTSPQNSRRILFQIQGEHLSYLRCHVLTEFNGWRWQEDPRKWEARPWRKPLKDDAGWPRRVRVKNIRSLGPAIPVDGKVTALKSTFFKQVRSTTHGTLETSVLWNAADKTYEYSIDPAPAPEELSPARKIQLTRHPEPSERLREWLEQRQQPGQDAYAQAKHLERYFQLNFIYERGAPRLNNLNPIDDFIFHQKRGHCERYASALALLLRLQGVPSRVVLGYVPVSRNWITGDHDIRACDAHAWAEAWFPYKGWILLDATPPASLQLPAVWLDWLEALDFAWYSYVVNFDTSTQNAFLQSAVGLAGTLLTWPARQYGWILALLLAALFALLASRIPWSQWRPGYAQPSPTRDQKQAEHFYGQMLQLLAQLGLSKGHSQTPYEYLAVVQQRWPGLATETATITDRFCAVYYGGRPFTSADRQQVSRALARITAPGPSSTP